MAGSLKWNGPAAEQYVRTKSTRVITACAMTVESEAKRLLSVPGTAKGAGGGKRAYGAERSKPGEPPRKQTGHLRGMVMYEVVDLVGRIGTNYKIGRWLELGTRFMAARPWLRVALQRMQSKIGSIVAGVRDAA